MRAVGWVVRGLLLLLVIIVLLLGAVRLTVLSWPASLPLIAHAGGRIDGHDYTSSIAALDESYARGFRTFEMDFQETSDGQPVCGRNWNAFPNGAPRLAEFEEWRRSHPFGACTLADLRAWFASHADATLVTDAKEDMADVNGLLTELLPGRVIVQAYSHEELCAYADAGVGRLILTLYRLDDVGASDLGAYLSQPCPSGRRAEAITMPVSRVLQGQAIIAKVATGLPVYVHTVDDCVFAWTMVLLGVDSLYTDTLAPGRCMLPDRALAL